MWSTASELGSYALQTKSQKAVCTLAIERIRSIEGQLWKPSAFETTFLRWPNASERKRINLAAATQILQQAGSESD